MFHRIMFCKNFLRPKNYCSFISVWSKTAEIKGCHSGVNVELEPNHIHSLYREHALIINEICSQLPHLKSQSSQYLWQNLISTLKDYNFNESEIFQVILRDPQVLMLPNNQLRSILDRWHHSQLDSDFINILILSNPSYLFITLPVIEKRLPLLQGIAKKPKTLLSLLINCPNVMTEQWEQIQAKLDYLLLVMRVDNSEIFQSSALGKTLEHIKLRHTLLDKCGLYKAPSLYEHKRAKNEKMAFQNPHLKRIVDNEDVSFARKICKISAEEYDAYSALFDEELKAEEEAELNSDSDSDSE